MNYLPSTYILTPCKLNSFVISINIVGLETMVQWTIYRVLIFGHPVSWVHLWYHSTLLALKQCCSELFTEYLLLDNLYAEFACDIIQHCWPCNNGAMNYLPSTYFWTSCLLSSLVISFNIVGHGTMLQWTIYRELTFGHPVSWVRLWYQSTLLGLKQCCNELFTEYLLFDTL